MARFDSDASELLSAPGRTQCHWIHPSIARLYIERAAYERAGRPRAIITDADIEAELAEIARRRVESR